MSKSNLILSSLFVAISLVALSTQILSHNSRQTPKLVSAEYSQKPLEVDYAVNETTPSTISSPNNKFYITQERADKYYGPAAREEMREYLKSQGQGEVTEEQLNTALKFNERLEYHQQRALTHPEEYQ